MARVKLGINNLSIAELIVKARQIATALNNNPNYTDSRPVVERLTAATDDLERANTDVQATKQAALTATTIRQDKSEALAQVLRQVAAYIESVAGDDEAKILSAGIHVKNPKGGASASAPVAPAGLNASAGDHDGEIDLAWDKVKGAKSYVIERSPDPMTATSWGHEAVSTKSSATVSGLASGTRYWFRVAAVTSVGQSGWSDPVLKMAP